MTKRSVISKIPADFDAWAREQAKRLNVSKAEVYRMLGRKFNEKKFKIDREETLWWG
jgi:hypothetical protein